MSIKHLNDDERSTYLLGLAIRRQLVATRDQETAREIGIFFRWLEQRLTPGEIDHIVFKTGVVTDDDFLADLLCDNLTHQSTPNGDPIN